VEKPFTVLDLAGTLAGLIATVKKVDR
jgi:hypothetical protein